MDREKSVPALQNEDQQNQCQNHSDKSGTRYFDSKTDAERPPRKSPGRVRVLLFHGACLHRCRPPATGTYFDRRKRRNMDSQAPRKDSGYEPRSAPAPPNQTFEEIQGHRVGERKIATRAEQPADELLHERNFRNLQHRQDADHPLRPAHLRLPCGRIRYADRRAGKDSRPHKHQHDPALRQVLRKADRQGNDEDWANIHSVGVILRLAVKEEVSKT